MHTVSSENRQIKIAFDKNISGWYYDKSNLKYYLDSYKDYASVLVCPQTIQNYKKLIEYVDNDSYFFNDNFVTDYQETLKLEQSFDVKRNLLKEKVNLDNIDKRPDLLDYTNQEFKPFKHQKIGLEYAVRFPGFYTLDEMGLGKTRIAIERHMFLKEKLNKIDKSFIVCPVSLMYNWANEIKKWSNGKYNYLIVSGTKKQKIEEIGLYKNSIDFFIINFEGIDSIKSELSNLIDHKTNIIIDEFIKIKNPSAQRTKSLIDLCNLTDYVHALCGTPISQGSIDLFAPSLCVDKGKKFGFSYDRFIEKYYWKYGFKLKPKKGTYEKLSNKLYNNALRFTKSECLDIPDKRYQDILIDLPPENLHVYNQMLNFAISQLDGQEVTAPIILVQLLRLSQITSGFIKTPENRIVEFKDQPKLDALSDILDSNNSTSIIIWSRFVRDIKAIAKLCMDKNISFGCLIGSSKDFDYETNASPDSVKKDSPLGMLIDLINPDKPINIDTIKKAYRKKVLDLHPDRNKNNINNIELLKKINSLYNTIKRFDSMDLPKNMQSISYNIPSNLIGTDSFTRQNIVDKFQSGNIQCIIGTASTGGLGINLTKAERVIYYANDYSLINRLQSEDRAHRAGQKNKVLYYDILANSTIDISILDILKGKKNIADIITKDNLLNIAKGK